MIGIIQKPWDATKQYFALLFPMFARNPAAGLTAGPAWFVRIVSLAVVLGLSAILNQSSALGIHSWLQTPVPFINAVWIPMLILAFYLTCWLGYWFWLTLHTDHGPVSAYPDIDSAWSQAVDTLAKAGIQLQDVPVFLVFGQSADGEEALFHAAGLKAIVNQVPRNPSAPIHVTATRDAIFVTCPGASCLGLHTAQAEEEFEPVVSHDEGEDVSDDLRTIGLGSGLKIDQILSQGTEVARKRAARKRAVEVEPLKSRLNYLCHLIRRDRQGFCPINGTLILIPAAATDPQGDAEEFARCCKTDLTVAFNTLGVRCPILALVCDVERIPGFSELLTHLPAGQTARRMGQRFPLVTDQRPPEVTNMLEGGIEWISQTLFPNLIYSLFRMETPGSEEAQGVVLENAALFRFLSEIRSRQGRLSRILTLCFSSTPEDPLLFGGCYLGGTGASPTTGQAFVSGVFKRLVQEQDLVTWSGTALKRDIDARRAAQHVSVALTLLNSVLAATVIYLAYRFFTRPS